jgi:hypothetical protein
VHCAPRLRPPAERLFLGDFRTSLPAAFERLGRGAALAHVDLGTEDEAQDRALAAAVAPLIDRLVVVEGIVLCDRPMEAAGWRRLTAPAETGVFPYYLYRSTAALAPSATCG